jgi:hypothetical protein
MAPPGLIPPGPDDRPPAPWRPVFDLPVPPPLLNPPTDRPPAAWSAHPPTGPYLVLERGDRAAPVTSGPELVPPMLDVDRPPVPVSEPRRPYAIAVVVLAGVLVVSVAGVAAARVVIHLPGGAQSGALPATTSAVPSTAQPTPSPTASSSPSPSTTAPGRPLTPDQALLLTDQQALDELTLETGEAAQPVAALAGTWVPQVSTKCVGVTADIGPGWFPDGTDDTPHVTIQQILAFHLSMHNRFGALTVRPTQLGVASDSATSGPCANLVLWSSVVPQSFPSAAAANAWCAVNVPPVRECAARYVARPGERSKQVLR